MKTNFLAILLAFALLVTCVFVAAPMAYAEEATETATEAPTEAVTEAPTDAPADSDAPSDGEANKKHSIVVEILLIIIRWFKDTIPFVLGYIGL